MNKPTEAVNWADAVRLKRALYRCNNELIQTLNATGYFLIDSKEAVAEVKAKGFKVKKISYYVVDTNPPE